MNEIALDVLFAARDELNTRTPPAEQPRHPATPTAYDVAAPADTHDAPDIPLSGAPSAALATALLASGALDAHIERIVRHILAEYDAQQNIYTRRAGGYRPGAFGSIG